jgi:hypothetical protein
VTDNKGMLVLTHVLLDRCERTMGHANVAVPTDDDPYARRTRQRRTPQ